MSKAEEYMGKEWLEELSRATGESIETLEKAEFSTPQDYAKPSYSDAVMHLSNFAIDMLCVSLKAFSEEFGAEKVKKIYEKAMFDFGYEEGKKVMKEMGKEDDHSLDTFLQISAMTAAVTEQREGFFMLSDKKLIETNANCMAPPRFKYHNVTDPEYCKLIGITELGIAKAVNSNLTIECPSCRFRGAEPGDPYCVYVCEIKE